MSVIRSVVTGVGSFLPEQVVTNADLAELVETTDEWIRERTGIRQRHKARDDQPTSDLAVEASKRALVDAGRSVGDIDLIVVATTTPDMTFPSVASIVQRKLGVPTCIAFDVQAVCSGFVYALSVADGFVARGLAKCALVIGAEEMTRLMDWTSKAMQVGMPILRWTIEATDGKVMSGVVVATTIKSTSCGPRRASLSARFAASTARSLVGWSSRALCRWRMPVRSTIHSSEVSTIFARSALVTTCSGRKEPTPVTALRMTLTGESPWPHLLRPAVLVPRSAGSGSR